MRTRKSFLFKSAAVTAAVTASAVLPGCSSCSIDNSKKPLKTKNPKKSLIAWYGQTGHTARYARLIEYLWKKEGLLVDNKEYRDVDISNLADYDIIMIGTPVYYYDTPENVKAWLKKIPEIEGVAVASFVSFGGPEGNQHNAATRILELLAEKGGVPVGIDYFMNMSSFPVPEWDTGGTIGHKHLPNEKTYERVRSYANQCLANIRDDKKILLDRHFELREMLTWLPVTGATKLFYRNHRIDKTKCIKCRACEAACPVGAISPDFFEVMRDRCIMCFGCFNNCPVQAVSMTVNGKELYNFSEFLKRNKIEVIEPEELG